MSASEQPRKPSWTESWNAKSAVAKRLSLSSAKTRLNLAILVFLFAPLAGFGLIVIGWENYLWVLGVPLLVVGLLAWTVGPVIAAVALLYLMARTLWQGGRPAAAATPAPPAGEAMAAKAESDASLAPALARLANVRQDLAAQRRQALLTGMPLAALVSLIVVWLIASNGGNSNLLALAFGIAAPLVFGMLLITRPFETRFKAAFKDEILPSLLEKYGTLRRVSDHRARYARAAAMGVVARHERAVFDDVFAGTHRGHGVEIADAVLLPAEHDKEAGWRGRKSQHRVLAVTLNLPRPVPAITAVLDAKRSRDQFQTPGQPYMRLDLEDVVFSSVYQVYSSDQVGGRALLSPAVMRRLLEVSDGHDFLPPTLMAQAGVLQLFLATHDERDLFEPGSVTLSDMPAHVAAIDRDLAQVFAIVDSLIDVAGTLTTPLFAGTSSN